MAISPQHIVKRYLKSDLLYFATIFLFPSILLGVILFVIYQIELGSQRELSETSQRQMVDTQAHFISADLSLVLSDLFYIAERTNVKDFFDLSKDAASDLAKDIRFFVEKKGIYDQLRILDLHGKERLRVDLREGRGKVVAAEDLQDKSDRYYFTKTIQLNRGELYISPFDLNMEKGEIERPLKPMIRFATPLYSTKGEKAGLVIFNYLGINITNAFRQAASGGLAKTFLLNNESYYLSSPDAAEEWGFILPERKGHLFAGRHPEAWQRIVKSEKGWFRNDKGLYTFCKVRPADKIFKPYLNGSLSDIKTAPSDYSWHIVSYISPDIEGKEINAFMVKLVWFCLVAGLFSAIGCLLVTFTRRKNIRAEEELVHKRKLAAMGEMSARLAHEIRDPLNRLGMVHEVLRESPDLSDTDREVLETMGETMEELFTMAMELLDYSRKDSLKREIFDLNRLLNTIKIQFDSKFSNKEINLITSFEEGVKINGDKFKVDHMVRNLVENAVQAMDEGGSLTLWMKTLGDKVEIGVEDTGAGIPEKDLENIFAPFFTTKTEGSGLGMPIVKNFAELHKGHVEIKSRIGEGTTVTITMPLE